MNLLLLFLVSSCTMSGVSHAPDRYTIICWGDSNTQYGVKSGESWVDYLRDTRGDRFRYINSGHGGWTMAQLVANYTADVHNELRSQNIVILLAGINDDGAGDSVDSIYARIIAGCNSARSEGASVIVSTYPINATNMFEVNDSIRTNYATFADGLIDLESDAFIGEACDPYDKTWFLDHVHWTVAGRQRYVDVYVLPAIKALL